MNHHKKGQSQHQILLNGKLALTGDSFISCHLIMSREKFFKDTLLDLLDDYTFERIISQTEYYQNKSNYNKMIKEIQGLINAKLDIITLSNDIRYLHSFPQYLLKKLSCLKYDFSIYTRSWIYDDNYCCDSTNKSIEQIHYDKILHKQKFEKIYILI
jgi:hypothetical protein